MALIPTINVCSKTGCSAITITDTAGAYHVSLNPTGWGAPNIDPTDAGFAVTVSINGGTAIDLLANGGFPQSTEVVTPAVAEILPIANTNAGSYSVVTLYSDYPAANTAITGTFQLLFGDSDNDIVYKLNNAFNAVSSGFFAYNDGFNVRIKAPVGSGTIYNGRTLRITSSTGTIWYTFGSTGVNAVAEVTAPIYGPVSGEFTYDDITTDLTDGWVTLVYTITTDTTTVSVTKKIFVYCDIKCCVFTKMALMKDLDPCKDTAELLKYLHMWNLYKTMIFEANGCNANEASNTLARLQALCNIDADCGCS